MKVWGKSGNFISESGVRFEVGRRALFRDQKGRCWGAAVPLPWGSAIGVRQVVRGWVGGCGPTEGPWVARKEFGMKLYP